MYPADEKNPSREIFIKSIEINFVNDGYEIKKVVIKRRNYNFIKKLKQYIQFYVKIFYSFFFEKYDLIYVHYVNHSLVPFFFLRYFLRRPFIINAHGGDLIPISKFSKLLLRINSSTFKYVNLFVVPSNFFRELLIDKYNIKKEIIFVTPSAGVNTNLFKPRNIKKEDFFTVGCVSRIEEGKGWNVLMESIIYLRNNGIKFKTILVGGGKELKKLKKIVENNNLSSNVLILGSIPHEKLPVIYNSFDVFVFPTQRIESLGLVAIEAMACGVPVIAPPIGGITDYLLDGKNGFYFNQGNSIDLAHKIEKYINLEPEKKKELKFEALRISKNFNQEVVNQKFVEYIKTRFL